MQKLSTWFFFWGTSRKIRKMTLVARQREYFWGFLSIFLVAELPRKRCFSTQEFIRFFTTILSQRRAIRIGKSLVIVIFMLRVLMYGVSYKVF